MVIMAGDGDKVVFKRSAERLHASVTGSVLRIIEGAGHMVHHLVPEQVVEAVEAVGTASPDAALAALRQLLTRLLLNPYKHGVA